MATSNKNDLSVGFIGALEQLYKKRKRGALATLRRSVYDPLNDARIFQVVGHAIDEDLNRLETDGYTLTSKQRRRETNVRLITACLFALYVQPFVAHQDRPSTRSLTAKWRSIGASGFLLRRTLYPEDSDDESQKSDRGTSLDQRMTALINSHVDDLPNRLRHLVHQLRSNEVPIDFSQLLTDLPKWYTNPREVRRTLAEDYWQPRPAQKKSSEQEA